MLFPTVVPRTKLTDRLEQVDVIRPDEVLSHANDSLGKGHLAMVIS